MGRLVRSVLAFVCALIALPVFAAAQDGATISGRVASEAGAPLNSASVFIEGMNIGTLTREDGHYSFVVPAARVKGQQVTITARLIGYRAQSATVVLNPGPISHDFVLAANPLRLGEVVVTGAGTQSTREKLGNVINTVDSAVIQRSNEPNVVNAIAGKAPNVNITSQSGEAGASSYIRIRGIKSLYNDDAQPLFVVDGVPVDNSTITAQDPTGGTAAPNRASDINPSDIESIQILKGAASAAIYGARASNGVVLITTKSGHSGGTRYSLRSSTSFDDVNKTVPLQTTYGQGSGGKFNPCTSPDCGNTSSSWGPQLDSADWVNAQLSGSCDIICANNRFAAYFPNGIQIFDHANELWDTGHAFDNTLTASGGNDRTLFYVSGGYLRQDGIIIGPNNWYHRATGRVKASHRIFDRLTIGGNINYIDARGSFTQKGSNVSGLELGELRTPPEFNNAYFLDSATGLQRSYRFQHPSPASLTRGRGYDNPFFVINDFENSQETNRSIGDLTVDYDPMDWLQLKYTLGGDYYSDYLLTGIPYTASSFPTGQVIRGDVMQYQIDHNLVATAQHTFDPNFSGTLTVGQNLNARRYRQNFTTGFGLIGVEPFALQNTTTWLPSEFRSLEHTESYFGQATVDLFNQLYLTGALRNDGFSTFGKSNPRAWYPKASVAWTFTNALGNTEQKGILSYGKLRAAYGETGKEPPVYATLNLLIAGATFGTGWGDYLNATQAGFGGLVTSGQLGNDNIKPERQKETELGFDLGFFDQKADLGATYYYDKSVDMILPVPIPATTGFTTALLNGATQRNLGYELTLNIRPVTRPNFSWDFGAQWGKNQIKELFLQGATFVANGTTFGGTFSGAYGAATVGGTLGLRGQDFVRCGQNAVLNGAYVDSAGGPCVGQQRGALYIDASGFPVADPTDRVIADPNPDWVGSLHTTIRFHKLQLSALLDHKQGGQVWDGTRGALYNFGKHKDTDIRGGTYVFGPSTGGVPSYPYLSGPVVGPGAGTPVTIDQSWFQGLGSGFGPVSAQFMEDGTYSKLREISVQYTFDQPWVSRTLSLSSIDVRVAGRNLHTWTKYTGIDPETNLGGAGVLTQGIDYFNNPQTRSIVLSVGLNR